MSCGRRGGFCAILLLLLVVLVSGYDELPEEKCPGSVKCGGFFVNTHEDSDDPIKDHGQDGLNLACRYNYIKGGGPVDVVVHFHGYSTRTGTDVTKAALSISGLRLENRRGARPTVALMARGKKLGDRRYDHPAMHSKEGFLKFVKYGLKKVSEKLKLEPALTAARLIVTAHSGGGKTLYSVCKNLGNELHEAYLYDATYGNTNPVKSWLKERIAADLKAIADLKTAGEKAEYMSSKGGACRNFYIKGTQTEAQGKRLAEEMDQAKELKPWYRNTESTVGHNAVPNKYGPKVLQDPNSEPTVDAEFPSAPAKAEGDSLFCYDSKDKKFEKCEHGLKGVCCAKHNNCCGEGSKCGDDKCVKDSAADQKKDNRDWAAMASAAASGHHSRYSNINTEKESKSSKTDDGKESKEEKEEEKKSDGKCRFVAPCDGTFTSPFATRWGSFHWGLDIAKGGDIPIYAIAAGKVIGVESACQTGVRDCGGQRGNFVQLQHEDGWCSQYYHLKPGTVKVKKDDTVSQGQEIGGMGHTGFSTGQHLHLEVAKCPLWPRKNSNYIDPCTGKNREGKDLGAKLKCPANNGQFKAKEC